jgi:hypothetical protein
MDDDEECFYGSRSVAADGSNCSRTLMRRKTTPMR